MRAVLAERVLKGPVLAGTDAVIEFLRLELGGLRHERFLALYLDARLHLLRIERIDGVKDGATGDIPRIIHCAMDVGASGIVLVHNHPSGEAMPSEADKRLTRSVAQIADTLNMVLVDHLIVTQSAVTSMRKHNFL